MQSELVETFGSEYLEVKDLEVAYQRGGSAAVDVILAAVHPKIGVRTKILNALLATP